MGESSRNQRNLLTVRIRLLVRTIVKSNVQVMLNEIIDVLN